VPPHGRIELLSSPPEFLRVRDLAGDTVALRHLTEQEDTSLVINSLEPLSDPEPLGIPEGVGNEGLSTKSRAVVCRNGREEEIPIFRMTIAVRSEFEGPLIVSGFEPFSDREIDEKEIRGVLLPPLGEAYLVLEIVEQGWITAFDARSRLVFTQELPREPFPVVTIPLTLPSEPAPIPTPETARGIGTGTDCSPITVQNLTLAAVAVAAAVIFGITIWGVWRWRRRRRAASI
jgi:hypothetical protein